MDHYLLIDKGTHKMLTGVEVQRLYRSGVIYACGDADCAANYHLHDSKDWPDVDNALAEQAQAG